jgi:hypothetical protein
MPYRDPDAEYEYEEDDSMWDSLKIPRGSLPDIGKVEKINGINLVRFHNLMSLYKLFPNRRHTNVDFAGTVFDSTIINAYEPALGMAPIIVQQSYTIDPRQDNLLNSPVAIGSSLHLLDNYAITSLKGIPVYVGELKIADCSQLKKYDYLPAYIHTEAAVDYVPSIAEDFANTFVGEDLHVYIGNWMRSNGMSMEQSNITKFANEVTSMMKKSFEERNNPINVTIHMYS